MKPCKFPEQNTPLPVLPGGETSLSRALAAVFSFTPPLTGYLQVASGDNLAILLFSLNGQPYAAGRFNAGKPANLTLAEFCDEARRSDGPVFSLHAIDPVLLKCFLVFLQGGPTIKAPVNLIDLEQVVRQIVAESGDALIVLEKERMCNFFFVKEGRLARPHLADSSWTPPDDLTGDEQLLMYAFAPSPTPVTAYVYRNVTTAAAADAADFGPDELLQRAGAAPAASAPAPAPAAAAPRTSPPGIAIEILDGAQQGARLTVPLPCRIGRKECDLVVNDQQVSRRHALIELVDGTLFLEDLGSTNGTFVNGAAVKRVAVSGTDVVTVGETRLRIVLS